MTRPAPTPRRSSPPTVGLLAATALLLGACAGGAVESSPPDPDASAGGTLTVGIGRPASVDPANAFDPNGLLVATTMCDSLIGIDPETSELVPALAESWVVSDGGYVITLKLRRGITFSDGSELTAQDVVYSLSRAASAEYAGQLADLLRPIDGWDEIRGRVEDTDQLNRERLRGVRVLTEQTVEIRLREPNAGFLSVLTHPVAAPVSRTATEADADAARHAPTCVGPYRLAEPYDDGDDAIVLERADTYYGQHAAWTNGGAGYVDEIRFKILDGLDPLSDPAPIGGTPSSTQPAEIATETTSTTGPDIPAPIVAAELPDLDGVDVAALPRRLWGQLGSSDGRRLTHASAPGIEFVGIPIPPLSGGTDETTSRTERAARQRTIRRALSLALDRQAIADDVFAGARLPATGFLPPTLQPEGVDTGCDNVPATPDPAAAREALDRAGAALDGATLTFLYNDDFRNRDLAAAVARQWEQTLGLQIRLEPVTFDELLDALDDPAADVDLFRTAWSVPYPSIEGYIYELFSSTRFGQGNLARYDNPVFDELMTDDVRTAEDAADRRLLLQDALDLICADVPLIPVTVQRLGYTVGNGIESTTGAVAGGYLGLPLVRELYVAG